MDPRFEEAFGRARSGDPRAFRTITEILAPKLVRFLTFFLRGDVHAAHDVAQETLVQAWDLRDRFVDSGHLRRWCFRVARCRAVTWIRRRAPKGRRMLSLDRTYDDGHPILDPPGRPPSASSEGDDLVAALRRAILRLPDRYAGPVHLYYVQGYGTKETAELLGIRRDAVKMQLHRARKILRREITAEVDRRHGPPELTPEERP